MTRGEVPRRHWHHQCGDWWSTVPSTRWSEQVVHCLTSPVNWVQWQLAVLSKVVLRVTRPRIRLRVIHPFIISRFYCFEQLFIYPPYHSTVLQFIHSTTQRFTNLHIYAHSLTHSLLHVSTKSPVPNLCSQGIMSHLNTSGHLSHYCKLLVTASSVYDVKIFMQLTMVNFFTHFTI
jgi:3-polyprenyl-4-hydroxybenzoate decarboxylase